MVRPPAVAGQFYPGNTERLRREVDSLLEPAAPKDTALGIVCPHAGYQFSGPTAGRVFSCVAIPSRMLLLGVNHHGLGSPFAVFAEGQWETPLGRLTVDNLLAARLLQQAPHLQDDPMAHMYEHSLEVELPFAQRLRPDTRIVPIIFASDNLSKLRAVGEAIGRVLREEKEHVLILASSDLNHYESQDIAERKDQIALDAILALDPERLMNVCEEEEITMCGVAPVCVMLYAVKLLGATRAELIDHRTSAKATGDYSSVVGYAGVRIV